MQNFSIYSSIACTLALTTLNLLSCVECTCINQQQKQQNTQNKFRKIVSYCCLLFLILGVDLSRHQLGNLPNFPLGYFIFLMSFSFGLIIFGMLTSDTSHKISSLFKVFSILCFTLMENTVCIQIIFSKNEENKYFDKKMVTLGQIFILLAFEFVLHYGIFCLILQIWNSSIKQSQMSDVSERQDIVIKYQRQVLDNHQISADQTQNRFILYGFPLVLFSSTIMISFLVGILEQISSIKSQNFFDKHSHFPDSLNDKFYQYSDKFWAAKTALAGIVLSILFPRFFILFDDLNHPQTLLADRQTDKLCTQSFKERTKIFILPIISFLLLGGRYLVQFS